MGTHPVCVRCGTRRGKLRGLCSACWRAGFPDEARADALSRRRGDYSPRPCAWCGVEFVPARRGGHGQLYHEARCRVLARNERYRVSGKCVEYESRRRRSLKQIEIRGAAKRAHSARKHALARAERLRGLAEALRGWKSAPAPPMLPAGPSEAERRARAREAALVDRFATRLSTVRPQDEKEYVRALRRDPCAYCGAERAWCTRAGTVDHIEPTTLTHTSDERARLRRGGSQKMAMLGRRWPELTGCCHACNSAKAADGWLTFMIVGRP